MIYNIVNKTVKYVKVSSISGGILGFTTGFINCKVADKPLIIERFVAGLSLGIFSGIYAPTIPLQGLYYLDCELNERKRGPMFNSWFEFHEKMTGHNGFRVLTTKEKNENMVPPDMLKPEELEELEKLKKI